MKSTTWSWVSGLSIAIVSFFFWCVLALFNSDGRHFVKFLGWFSLLFAIIYQIYVSNHNSKKRELGELEIAEQESESNKNPKENSSVYVLPKIGNSILKYKYDDVFVAGVEYSNPNYSELEIGNWVSLSHEPDNEYDNKAIAVMCRDVKIGYIQKGKFQDMILDFQKKNEPIHAHISNINESENKIYLFIGFYKNPLNELEGCEFIKATLIKTSKRIDEYDNRQDNFISLEEGELLSLEYDYDTETYIVYNGSSEEIGEISTSVSEKLRDKEDSYELVPVLDELTENDNGKYGGKIKVYLK